MPDNLPGTFSMHADEPTFTKVEDVAGISQLMLCRDRDDAQSLASDEFGELDCLPTTAQMPGYSQLLQLIPHPYSCDASPAGVPFSDDLVDDEADEQQLDELR